MRSPIATLGIATALASCCPLAPPAHAELFGEICVQVIVAGVVNAGLGELCAPTPFPTTPTHTEFGLQPYVWIIIDYRAP